MPTSPQHQAVLNGATQPLSAERRPEPGPIAILPNPKDVFADAVRAGGGEVAELSAATRGIVWLSSKTAADLVGILRENPRIGWVQLPWAGVDAFASVLASYAETSTPLWTSAKGAYSQPVAEHALALALALLRVFPKRVVATSWSTVPEGTSLFGLNVVIIGAGGIAVELIRLLELFGVHVTVVRRSTEPMPGAERTVTNDRLLEVLPDADVVVVAAAFTAATTKLIGAEQLSAMKPTAVLVNIARGGPRRHGCAGRRPERRHDRGRRPRCHRPGAAPGRTSPVERAESHHHSAQCRHAVHDGAAARRTHPDQRRGVPRRRPLPRRCRPEGRILMDQVTGNSYWAGSYTASMDGTSEGIGRLRPRESDGSLEYLGLAARTSCPSFLVGGVVDGIVYATDEANARVEAFRRDGDTLVGLGGQATSGALPCHISATAEWLYVANYFSGTVDVFPLKADGTIGPIHQTLAGSGSGPNPVQDGPHAHSTLVMASGVLSADLGSDQVHLQRWNGGALERTSSVPFPPGTGPRDFVVATDGRIYLCGELTGEVFELGESGEILRSGPSVVDPVDGDHWAGLVVDEAARYLYTGLRGSNRIAVVDAATLSPIAAISCGGDWPRNLWLAGEMLYVANERSSTVTSFRVDPVTGIPSQVGSPEAVPTPTYLLPAS